jgi:Fe2+ or Zn2+ uptake regulation protein
MKVVPRKETYLLQIRRNLCYICSMIDPQEELKDTLKRGGQSLTKPRQIVFAALQNQEPQAMQRLVKLCAEQIDRATVYRTVAVFEKLGIVQRLQIGWKYKLELSDDFHDHHHHLTCTKCGKTFPFEEDVALEERMATLAANYGFMMRAHQLEIQGLCSNCS